MKDSKVINFDKSKFDFIYLDPPYQSNLYEKVLEQIFASDFIKKNTLIICEHSKSKIINASSSWKIKDTRLYGQTKLTFLIQI